MQQKLLSLHLSCWSAIYAGRLLCQGVTLQPSSLLTMLLHVFVSPVCTSPIHVTAQRTNSLLKQRLTFCLAAAMTTVAAGLPGTLSFLCREICSYQWRSPPKRGVHCRPQGQEGVMISQPIKVCAVIIFLPILPPPPCLELVSWVEKHRSSGVWVLAKHVGDLESISLPAAIILHLSWVSHYWFVCSRLSKFLGSYAFL